MTVRTLIIEDSPTMQALIRRKLSCDRSITIVGTAANANEARTQIKALDPDVVTLDVEMPGMNGLDFLERLMRLRPTPVVMLSSLTAKGAEISLAALEFGAFDCFDKARLDQLPGVGPGPGLAEIIRAAARSRRGPLERGVARSTNGAAYKARATSLIAIGASTGGVEALIELLGAFPENCPPTMVVQHMPETFTPSFAARLDRLCRPKVEEARSGAILLPGRVYLAPGGSRHLEIGGESGRFHCRLIAADKMNGHRPSVDRLFHSVARIAAGEATGAILTGMGNDGAKGLKAMRDAGALTFGQDKATSVVYGMPGVAQETGAVMEQLPLRRIAGRLLEVCAA
jgi:two-component system chemotaxis response regulator CheB